jgi:hypothetical protein
VALLSGVASTVMAESSAGMEEKSCYTNAVMNSITVILHHATLTWKWFFDQRLIADSTGVGRSLSFNLCRFLRECVIAV